MARTQDAAFAGSKGKPEDAARRRFAAGRARMGWPTRALLATFRDLLRELAVRVRAHRVRRVLDQRPAVTRRLGDADAARDHGPEHEIGKVLAKLMLDVVSEPGALVGHRNQKPADHEPGIEFVPDQVQG